MPTINQLIRHGREKQVKKSKAPLQKPSKEGRLSVGDHDFP